MVVQLEQPVSDSPPDHVVSGDKAQNSKVVKMSSCTFCCEIEQRTLERLLLDLETKLPDQTREAAVAPSPYRTIKIPGEITIPIPLPGGYKINPADPKSVVRFLLEVTRERIKAKVCSACCFPRALGQGKRRESVVLITAKRTRERRKSKLSRIRVPHA